MAEAVRVEGADQLQAALKRYPAVSKKALRSSNAQVARKGREWSRNAAQGGTPLQSKMAGGIGSAANSTSAQITVRNTTRAPGAQVAFFGAKRKTGWYARPRYNDSPPQFQPWVGNRWTAATRGQGPYVINDMLAARLRDLQRMYLDGQWKALLDSTRSR